MAHNRNKFVLKEERISGARLDVWDDSAPVDHEGPRRLNSL